MRMRTRESAPVARGRDLARRRDPVELGHADVHQHDVGPQPLRAVDGLLAVGRLADDRDVVLGLEHHPEARPHERLVVGDEDADAHRASVIGSDARTTKPPSGRRPACSSPPYSATRSRIPTRP